MGPLTWSRLWKVGRVGRSGRHSYVEGSHPCAISAGHTLETCEDMVRHVWPAVKRLPLQEQDGWSFTDRCNLFNHRITLERVVRGLIRQWLLLYLPGGWWCPGLFWRTPQKVYLGGGGVVSINLHLWYHSSAYVVLLMYQHHPHLTPSCSNNTKICE